MFYVYPKIAQIFFLSFYRSALKYVLLTFGGKLYFLTPIVHKSCDQITTIDFFIIFIRYFDSFTQVL